MTCPPRPPIVSAPPPSAPRNAGRTPEETLALTETLAEVVSALSALLVAVTVSVPGCGGAVYCPVVVICPSMAFHATDLSVAVPVTEAVNCRVPPVVDEADLGVMATAVTVDAGEPGFDVEAVVTITFAVPDLVASALLVAVMVSTTAVVGAV